MLMAGVLTGCADGTHMDAMRFGQPSATDVFSAQTKSISLEIDYARGAEPATGVVPGVGIDTWTLFTNHVQRIFANASPKQIDVPNHLKQMEAFDLTGDSFTEAQILAIADLHRNVRTDGSHATFYAVWLSGFYNDGSGPRPDVLGVSIGLTGVIAMFKPAVVQAAGDQPFSAPLLEQFALLHEFGHAVGLVDNGIAPTTAHTDTTDGAHCTNPACVMFHANEGAAAALDFSRRITTGTEMLFGDECLADVDSFATGAH
jgi:hypothetical protein